MAEETVPMTDIAADIAARRQALALQCAYELEGIGAFVLDANCEFRDEERYALRGMMLRVRALAGVIMNLQEDDLDDESSSPLDDLERTVHGPYWCATTQTMHGVGSSAS